MFYGKKINAESTFVSFSNLLFFYAIILLILPNDVFISTSIYTFKTPADITYKWSDFYISYLYLPIVAYSVYLSIKDTLKGKKRTFELPLFAFLFFLFVKDLLYNALIDDYMFENSCFEYYFEFLVAFSLIKLFYFKSKNSKKFIKLFIIFSFLNFCVLLFGFFTKHVSVNGDYAYRYTGANLNQNATGYLFFLAASLVVISNYKYKWFLALLFFSGIILTGNRSGLMFSLFFFAIYSLIRINRVVSFFKKPQNVFILLNVVIVSAIVLLAGTADVNNRLFEMINGVLKKGLLSYIKSDDASGVPRSIGFNIGMNLLSENWLFGSGLSAYSLQKLWTTSNGTSAFPHFDVMCLWMMFGVSTLLLLFVSLKSVIYFFKTKNIYWLFGFSLLLKSFVDGGLWLNSKNIFFIAYAFSILYYVYKEEKYINGKRSVYNNSKL